MAKAQEGSRRIHTDTIVGTVLLLLCAFGLWLTTGFDSVPAILSQNVPPTFFPRLVLALIALGSLALIAGGLRQSPQDIAIPKPVVLSTAVVIVMAPFSIILIGTLATIFLIGLLLPLLWRERRIRLILLLAAGLPVAVYVVFTVALGVRFPLGFVASLAG